MTVCFIFYANLTPNYSCYLNLWNLCQFSVSLFEASFSVLFLCQVILAGYFDWPVKMVAESQIARSHHVQSFLCPNQKLSFYLHRPRYKILLPMFSAGSPCCDAFTNLYFGYRSLTFFGKAYLLILTDYCKFYIDLKTGKSLQLHYNQFFFYYISFRIL